MADNKQNTDQNSAPREVALNRINREFEEKAAAERAKTLNLPYADVGKFPINPDILHLISKDEATTALIMPFYKSGKKVRVAVADPQKPEAVLLLKNLEEKGYTISVSIGSQAGILDAFRAYESDQYKSKIEAKNIIKSDEISFEKELTNIASLKDEISKLPAAEALNMLYVSAIKAGASDIHYEPSETLCAVRFRIDGVLHNVFELEKDVYERLVNQLKYVANMKLNITTVPQDGRLRFSVNERKIDVRVSALPTEYGEAFVCRILDAGKDFASFAELGFVGRSLEILDRSSELSQGMILVTGPTNSGKTTTLYVLMSKFNNPETKIISLEDPVEYHLKGITQSQINEKRGYTFASGLRSILRQDPNVIMIGEIRDLDTAEVSVQAALTGHVLLSTLHTNGAVESIARLITIGVPAFMISPALSVIVAQRLVRKLCTCAVDRPITPEEKTDMDKMLNEIKAVDPKCTAGVPENLKKSVGCELCNNMGFRGQMVISEVLEVNDEIKDAVLKNKSASEIFALARKTGMLKLEEDALLKVINGITTIEEVHRVTNA